MRNKIKKIIKEVLKEFRVNLKALILFGSRAKGNENKYSDWDFLIIVKEDLSFPKKRKIAKEIRVRLAESFIPCDIIIKSESEIEYYKNFIGSITRQALKEGIKI